jgi:hypothetical protein
VTSNEKSAICMGVHSHEARLQMEEGTLINHYKKTRIRKEIVVAHYANYIARF